MNIYFYFISSLKIRSTDLPKLFVQWPFLVYDTSLILYRSIARRYLRSIGGFSSRIFVHLWRIFQSWRIFHDFCWNWTFIDWVRFKSLVLMLENFLGSNWNKDDITIKVKTCVQSKILRMYNMTHSNWKIQRQTWQTPQDLTTQRRPVWQDRITICKVTIGQSIKIRL